MRVLSRFMVAATDVSRFPRVFLPEVAFLGRSNVGKSSVINSLLGSKIARTSSTPGRTQSINFYEIRFAGKPTPEMVFADLPGYGYSRVPRAISATWPTFIEPYLRERPTLVMCIALVDLNVPPQPVDKELLAFLQTAQRPFMVIGTKCDKLSNNQIRNSLQIFTRDFPAARVFPFSAKAGTGREELWREIRSSVDQYRLSQV
jgi:GTP-binding protein